MQANCQGDELETLLNASAAFRRRYRLARYTNYTREIIPEEALARCSVFLYQHLEGHWGDLSSASLLSRLSPAARSFCIPNLLFTGYWPFWTRHSPIDFGDSLLNRLIDEGAPKAAILKIYLHGDIRSFVDLDANLERCLAIEARKEAKTPFKVLDFIRASWRERPVFYTINHPGDEVMLRIAQGILAALDLPSLSEDEFAAARAAGFPSYTEFSLPIHPQVAAHFNLPFGGPDTEYNVFGRRMTFARYISRYIDCRLNGMDKDFTGYLQVV